MLPRLSPYTEGIEAALNFLLHAILSATVPPDPDDLVKSLNRVIASAARLHRSRSTALAKKHQIEEPLLPAVDSQMEIARILRLVSVSDGDFLSDVGLGYTDREIGDRRASSPGAVRVRLSRLRSKLAA
jgi:DNA-binding NarL/FixJ family response regulator